jgi:CsoR family transcriptional regulator, copper-sensing transcriptional repressor
VGALRLLRVRRILKAGKILRTRLGLTGPVANVVGIGVTLVGAAFVTLVLADPTSESRQFLDGTMERFGPGAIILAGAILAGSTYLVYRYRNAPRDLEPQAAEGAHLAQPTGQGNSSLQTGAGTPTP